jgi:hypothetical protein
MRPPGGHAPEATAASPLDRVVDVVDALDAPATAGHAAAHARGARSRTAWLYAATIFASAFLLFLVQPIMAKQILPWFGGSAAVWSVCMVFFQVTLLAGYAYADLVVRRLAPRTQAVLHIVLLAAAAATLPILAGERWKPAAGDEPTLLILALLLATIGLPYFVLSTTGPLLQAWLARAAQGAPWAARVYRLFSLSNFASLLALLAYPVVLEPHTPLRVQALTWSGGFGVFALLAAVVAWQASRVAGVTPCASAVATSAPAAALDAAATAHSPRPRPWLWLALPAMGSWLLIAVTNHLTHHVASIPFLWVLPLVTYLVTFILCFESDRWYRRTVFLPAAAIVMVASAWAMTTAYAQRPTTGLPLFTGALFVWCMVLHGETARMKPPARHLTRFYLMLSAGGALGGAFVGLVAPVALDGNYELGLGLFVVGMLGVAVFDAHRAAAWASLAVAAACAAFVFVQASGDRRDARVITRNFYGTLQTYDSRDDPVPADRRRILLHGSIKHGEQFLAPDRSREPTAYYGVTSGIGRVLLALPGTTSTSAAKPARVGLVGLGAGTLVVYARPGDVYRLYELDPEVFDLARREFTFLRDTPARVEDVVGDARLSMEREPAQRLDVLAVDAFSGGSVPVHLLTTQALDVYLKHLAPGGVIAFHLTNRHLDLPPVVLAAARERGLHARVIRDEAEHSEHLRRTTWVLIAREAARLDLPVLRDATVDVKPAARAWSDDFHDLLSILK